MTVAVQSCLPQQSTDAALVRSIVSSPASPNLLHAVPAVHDKALANIHAAMSFSDSSAASRHDSTAGASDLCVTTGAVTVPQLGEHSRHNQHPDMTLQHGALEPHAPIWASCPPVTLRNCASEPRVSRFLDSERYLQRQRSRDHSCPSLPYLRSPIGRQSPISATQHLHRDVNNPTMMSSNLAQVHTWPARCAAMSAPHDGYLLQQLQREQDGRHTGYAAQQGMPAQAAGRGCWPCHPQLHRQPASLEQAQQMLQEQNWPGLNWGHNTTRADLATIDDQQALQHNAAHPSIQMTAHPDACLPLHTSLLRGAKHRSAGTPEAYSDREGASFQSTGSHMDVSLQSSWQPAPENQHEDGTPAPFESHCSPGHARMGAWLPDARM